MAKFSKFSRSQFVFAAALQFSPAQMKKEMQNFITQSRPHRSVGSPGHEKAFTYLKEEFEKLAKKSSGKVYVHTFYPDTDFAAKTYQNDFDAKVEGKVPSGSAEYEKWKVFTGYAMEFVRKYKDRAGRNLILEFKGKKRPSEVIYVGAHYDTITHDHKSMQFTPEKATDGADDNASGVEAVLSIARALAKTPHDRTVRFVFFDYEEIFFLGSYALAKDLAAGKIDWAPKAETFGGLFNLEMIGWSRKQLKAKPVVKLYIRANHDGKNAENASDKVLADIFVLAAKKHRARLRPVILANGFDRSDNWSFWQHHLSAVCISQDWEKDFNQKHYHTSTDTVNSLNLAYLAEVTRITAEAVKAALSAP